MKEICYLKEFQHFDGEEFITFNIYFLNREKNVVTLVITNRGKISILDYLMYYLFIYVLLIYKYHNL